MESVVEFYTALDAGHKIGNKTWGSNEYIHLDVFDKTEILDEDGEPYAAPYSKIKQKIEDYYIFKEPIKQKTIKVAQYLYVLPVAGYKYKLSEDVYQTDADFFQFFDYGCIPKNFKRLTEHEVPEL